MKKSFNVQALRGHDYDDKEFQQEMKEVGIDIPDSLLYTPDLGPYVINKVHDQTIFGLTELNNDETGRLYTQDEANKVASQHKSAALDMYKSLL